jgi:hypothetical protein
MPSFSFFLMQYSQYKVVGAELQIVAMELRINSEIASWFLDWFYCGKPGGY